jgi:hypothetical protein
MRRALEGSSITIDDVRLAVAKKIWRKRRMMVKVRRKLSKRRHKLCADCKRCDDAAQAKTRSG